MASIPAREWNRLAATSPTPLMSHEWLAHLEQSGSIVPEQEWEPRHITVHERDTIVAALPLWRRGGSWGEFVFDYAFANVAEQIGAPYYPKLVGMSPATPSPAYHPLVEAGREAELSAALLTAVEELRADEAIPTVQFNYVLPEWRARFERAGFVAWEHHGYEWRNESFATFDGYLERFRKNQRRNIRRERESMGAQGVRVEIVPGEVASERLWRWMRDFYVATNAQFGPWAARFLTGRFFTEMPSSVRRHALLVVAWDEGGDPDPLAMAMLVRGRDRLLGRYWGSRSDRANLHFELCYYAPIEWAIGEGIDLFDPGMGSEHKVRRGFRSVATYSLHRFADRHMDAILRANIDRINAAEEEQIAWLDAAVPYRRDG